MATKIRDYAKLAADIREAVGPITSSAQPTAPPACALC